MDTNDSEIQEATEDGQTRDNAVAAIGVMKSLVRQHDSSKKSPLEDDSLEIDLDKMTGMFS